MGKKPKHSRLSGAHTRRLLEHFVAGTTARTAAELVGVNRNTATHFYHRLRKLIAARLQRAGPLSAGGEVEVDEVYFCGAGKTRESRIPASNRPVFGLLSRGGKIQTMMVPNTQQDTLLPLLRNTIDPEAIVYTDAADISDALGLLGLRHRQVDHSDRFAPGPEHMNGMENFWNQARRHLRKYNGVPRHHLHLYLKECEWRFNYGSPRQLLAILAQWVRQDL